MDTPQVFPPFLARLDEVQEEQLDYPPVLAFAAASALAKSFLCDGQGAVRRAILSL